MIFSDRVKQVALNIIAESADLSVAFLSCSSVDAERIRGAVRLCAI